MSTETGSLVAVEVMTGVIGNSEDGGEQMTASSKIANAMQRGGKVDGIDGRRAWRRNLSGLTNHAELTHDAKL